MDNRQFELVSRLAASGIILQDPQWLNRLDEPAPLRVVLEIVMQLLERAESPNLPFD